MKKNKAFTLIELVVWITVSMLLMVSVWIFVNNWMANILTQQKVIENTTNLTDFTSQIHSSINLIESWSIFPTKTLSWVLFKRNKEYWNWWFTYIWTTISTTDSNWNWIYCESGSELTNTKHIFIKNFIPFEEEGEDIFNDYNSILGSKLESIWSKLYKSFQKDNIIAIKNWPNWDTVIWKWIFWNKFKNWDLWTNIYLNSPTWIEKINDYLLISDTLNNRILYYDTNSQRIYKLLDETDWLNEPTWLYYDSSNKALYISNSWNWEILKYSSKSESEWILSMTGITANNINKIKLYFYKSNWEIANINWPTKYTIETNWSSNDNYFYLYANTILYFIAQYSWIDQDINECDWHSAWDEILVNSDPVKCTDDWTWQTSSYVNISYHDDTIKVNNIDSLTDTWSYYIKLKLFNEDTEKFSKYYPYFTKSDDNILTKDDNILTVYKSNLKYPTWIWWTSTSDFNEFWNKSWRDFNTVNFTLDNNDTTLKSPIKKLETFIENESLTLKLSYYKKFNCYNLDDKTIRTYLFKKNLK